MRRVKQRATGRFLAVEGRSGSVGSSPLPDAGSCRLRRQENRAPQVGFAALPNLRRQVAPRAVLTNSPTGNGHAREDGNETDRRDCADFGPADEPDIQAPQGGRDERRGTGESRNDACQILMQAKGLVVKAPGDDSPDLIPVQVLKRMAVVCVRPSTQTRVMTNLQSERQHYDLVDIARQHGLADIKFIDDDLGRTASGTLARLPPPLTGPSDALIAWWRGGVVAWSCAGKVGAVLCLDASRLARKGRGWHHLPELCGRGRSPRPRPRRHLQSLSAR